MTRLVAIVALLLTLPLAAPGCGKSAPSEEPTASGKDSGAKKPAAKAASDKRRPELEVSKPKDYKPEADGPTLGTLPEGIGVAVGQKAPDFETRDADGKRVTLDGLVSKGEVLLVFYRGGW